MESLNKQIEKIEEVAEQISDVVTLIEEDFTIHLQSRELMSFRTNQEIIEISKGGKVGLMRWDCKILIPPTFDAIRSYYKAADTIIVERITKSNPIEKKVGAVSFDGTIILEVKYDEITYMDSERYVVRLNNQYAVIGHNGEVFIQFGTYDYIDNFVRGLSRVKKDNKWGLINKYGCEILSPEFDDIWKIKDGMATTKVLYQGEEFYLLIDKCPSEMRDPMDNWIWRNDTQILFKYKNQKYKKLEYPEIDVYDLEEERKRWIKKEIERREWEKEVRSMRLDVFEGDEDLYNEWNLNS